MNTPQEREGLSSGLGEAEGTSYSPASRQRPDSVRTLAKELPPFQRLAPLSRLRRGDQGEKSFLSVLTKHHWGLRVFKGRAIIQERKKENSAPGTIFHFPTQLFFSFLFITPLGGGGREGGRGTTSESALGYLFSSPGGIPGSSFSSTGHLCLVLTFSLLTSTPEEDKQWGHEFRQFGDSNKRTMEEEVNTGQWSEVRLFTHSHGPQEIKGGLSGKTTSVEIA